MRTIRLHHYIVVTTFLILQWVPISTWAAGQLMVAPTRVIFEARDRTAKISLVNNGDETTTYRLQFTRKRMTEEGQFEDVEKPQEGEQFSDEMIRFSPRQVTLPPGQSQTIRLILRKPANLPAGEYRSHLLFKSVPRTQSSSIESLDKSKSEGLNIELTPVLGISIPVIVRHGKTEAKVTIEDVKLGKTPKGQDAIQFILQRSGNQSVYGDFHITFQKGDGKPLTLSKANGISVYTPNSKRIVSLPLYVPKGIKLQGGQLTLVYSEPVEQGGGQLARQTLNVQ